MPRTPSWGYVWILRSTPLLMQLLFRFNIGALCPTLGLGLPFGPQFITVKVKTVNRLRRLRPDRAGVTLWYIEVTGERRPRQSGAGRTVNCSLLSLLNY
ncbi:hypothetical protein STRIP9103_08477 [Streptomyces ipomoeae 91-03]|uniref:Uncharacterized protein n=1 Tax=Streptomyces ipomoeae 91-03 TaxID=698759 RepID=L1KVT2_9ACTN|nr:hypothetical protein STRIP9103_08477 [Streptomyces ipomoeae 91-03]